MKFFRYAMLAFVMISFASCSNNDEPPTDPDLPQVTEGAYVLCQGNFYNKIEGSLDLLDYTNGTCQRKLFLNANGRSMGSTPQDGLAYGSKIYLAIYESNVIDVIDRTTYKSIKQISLAEAEGQNPRSLVAKNGKVYISMYNGYVSRLDTLSLAIDKTIAVGPNPEIMAIHNNYLYVPNSDGMNWMEGYGTTASKINLSSFTVEKTFTVGLNPCEFVSNGSALFLLCKGDYYTIPSKIYKIGADDTSEEIVDATLLAVDSKNLYYIDAPYGASEFIYGTYSIDSHEKASMIKDGGVDSPASIGVDPINGNIVITSYNLEYGYPSYSLDGYAKVYSNAGNLLYKYDVGVGPVCIFFNNK